MNLYTKFSSLCLACAWTLVLMTGCLGDDKMGSGGQGDYVSKDPVLPDNSTIDARIFASLDLTRPGLASVKAYYDEDQYYLAAQALLEYYRNRTGVTNSQINLIAPTVSAEEKQIADWALPKNDDPKDGYRFYTEGYEDGGRPYSYQKSNSINWAARANASTEERFRLHRLAWMDPEGKAYRATLDEVYAESWAKVYGEWHEKFPRPAGITDYNADPEALPEADREAAYAWRPQDVAERMEGRCNWLYYYLHSTSLTPTLFAAFLSDTAADAEHLAANSATEGEEAISEAHALFRIGSIFPEMKQAAQWVATGSEVMNDGIDTSFFDLLNLEYGGLLKVKRAVEQKDYNLAMNELLTYFRTRPHGLNPNVDFENTTASATEKSWADYALRENGYRFYVKNYFDTAAGENVPYSYMNEEGTGIKWDYRFTGEQEQLYQIHRHQWMVPQAKTYVVTGDERYVLNWIEVYGDWIKQNPKPEQGTDVTNHRSWRPLDVAARLIDQCALLEYYQHSPSITAEWLCTVLTHLVEHGNHIMNNYSDTSNHLITQAQAVTFAGMLFPELKSSIDWRQSGPSVLNREVNAQYTDDGWLKDGDLHYHIAGIADFRLALEVAQRCGEESSFPSAYIESMKKMTDVVMNMIYPDYTNPLMCDTRVWSASVLKRNLGEYSKLFPDNQEMKWMATAGLEGAMPTHTMKLFPGGGYYILRSGWTKQDMMMVLQNRPDGDATVQWHRQKDNGTFELWVKGRNFFPDSGCYSYGGTTSSNASRAKYAATTMHNTLTLNDANVASKGTMVNSGHKTNSGVEFDYVILENPSYSGLTHRRTVWLVNKSFYVLLDEANGEAAGTLNLNFNITEGSDSEVVLDSDDLGFHTAFSDKNNLVVRTHSTVSGATLAEQEGSVSRDINKADARKAYSIDVEKAADKNPRFVTFIIPTADASTVNVKVNSTEVNANEAIVRMELNGTTYKLSANFYSEE